MTQRIECQACDPGAKPQQGCSNCGGYGYKLLRLTCPTCAHPHWDYVRGGFTVHDNKEFKTYDGVTVTVHFDRPWSCSKCPTIACGAI